MLIATHFNTSTYHNHLVINSVSYKDGQKFNCDKRAFYRMREISDALCREHNLTVIEHHKGKTPRSIYFAEKMGLDPHKVKVISIMPCLAKKEEAALEPMRDACGDPDVDIVLTTREFVRMLRSDHILVDTLEEAPFDSPLGASTGAAVIFGATGGVMDAALRSAYFLITGRNPNADTFRAVRGMDNGTWKEASFNIPGAGVVRVAVVSSLGRTRKLMDALRRGDVQYDFVEVMACPGGCAGGGGQPIVDGVEMAEYRGGALWDADKAEKVRFSHENEDIRTLYRDYLEKPCGERSHHLLHTNHHAWEMPQAPSRL